MNKKQIYYIWWLPWSWKTTLANKLQQYWSCIHIDSDETINELIQDKNKLIKYIANQIPKKIKDAIKNTNNPKEIISKMQESWIFEQYINKVVCIINIKKAIRLRKKTKKHIVISSLLSSIDTRTYVYEILKKEELAANLIYINSTIEEILEANEDRSWKKFMINYTKQELKNLNKEEDSFPKDEWWNIINLERKNINTKATNILEIKSLLI